MVTKEGMKKGICRGLWTVWRNGELLPALLCTPVSWPIVEVGERPPQEAGLPALTQSSNLPLPS